MTMSSPYGPPFRDEEDRLVKGEPYAQSADPPPSDADPFGPDPDDRIAAWQTDPARRPGDVLPAHLDYRNSDPFAPPPRPPDAAPSGGHGCGRCRRPIGADEGFWLTEHETLVLCDDCADADEGLQARLREAEVVEPAAPGEAGLVRLTVFIPAPPEPGDGTCWNCHRDPADGDDGQCPDCRRAGEAAMAEWEAEVARLEADRWVSDDDEEDA